MPAGGSSLVLQGTHLIRQRRPAEALAKVEAGLALTESLLVTQPKYFPYQMQKLSALTLRADLLERLNRHQDAKKSIRELIAFSELVAATSPSMVWVRTRYLYHRSVELIYSARDGETADLDRRATAVLAALPERQKPPDRNADVIRYNVALRLRTGLPFRRTGRSRHVGRQSHGHAEHARRRRALRTAEQSGSGRDGHGSRSAPRSARVPEVPAAGDASSDRTAAARGGPASVVNIEPTTTHRLLTDRNYHLTPEPEIALHAEPGEQDTTVELHEVRPEQLAVHDGVFHAPDTTEPRQYARCRVRRSTPAFPGQVGRAGHRSVAAASGGSLARQFPTWPWVRPGFQAYGCTLRATPRRTRATRGP